ARLARVRLRRAADVDDVDGREFVDFRVIVFFAVVFWGAARVPVPAWAAAMSADRPTYIRAVRTHQKREVLENRGKITSNPLGDSWLQNVSAF
ncbi:MAG TPA: hypothetical protein VFS23_06070, partial [Vicinamibacterales bacterium]|nr:hypothetical protein [Vicinamibacterales bacterium]